MEGYYAELLLAGFTLASLVTNIDPKIIAKIIAVVTVVLLVYVASDRSLNSFVAYITTTLVPKSYTYGVVSVLVKRIIFLFLIEVSLLLIPTADNVVMTTLYFTLFGIGATIFISYRVVRRYSLSTWNEVVLCRFPYFQTIEVTFTGSQIVTILLDVFFGVWYACQKHWFTNNILTLTLSIQAIEALTRLSFKTHTICFVALFLYAYGELNGMARYSPITFVFPAADSPMSVFKFDVIDVIVPGLFIAKLLRYDISRRKVTRYFEISLFGYFASLAFSMIARTWLEAAKYEFLFIGPVVMGFVVIYSVWDGHTCQLWAFNEFGIEELSVEPDHVSVYKWRRRSCRRKVSTPFFPV